MQVINTRCFRRCWPVSWTITHHFGVPERFLCLPKPKVRLRVVHQHSPFWPILARFMGYCSSIWGSGAIFMVTEPQCALTCRSLKLAVLADFVLFRGPFWSPGAIFMIAKPQGVFTYRSSTLAVLADSSPFHGLLLTVFGSLCDFHGCRTPSCYYVQVINTNHFV